MGKANFLAQGFTYPWPAGVPNCMDIVDMNNNDAETGEPSHFPMFGEDGTYDITHKQWSRHLEATILGVERYQEIGLLKLSPEAQEYLDGLKAPAQVEPEAVTVQV